jgi:3D (Asp-Asp-Asp) domain-containing protein/septal ring factor EnvC (AmiA/AmiB activator)
VGTYSTRGAARLVAVLTGFALPAAVPIALAADASGSQSQAAGLHAGAGSLAARANAATLQLYALESDLRRAQADLGALAGRRAQVEQDRAATARQLDIATEAVHVSETQLAVLVRALYEQPDQGDPLAVLLSSESLDEALAGLDSLSRAAGQNNRIIEQARESRKHLAAIDARLAKQATELDALAAAAEQRVARLAATAAARRSFVAGLRRQEGLNAARIAAIEAQVRTAEQRSAKISPTTQPVAAAVDASVSAPVAIAASVPGTLTVSSTGYSIHGRTSTGMQTAAGVVAVDPSVIPLGTRLTIPGYGTGIAADTGGSVHGNVIDLWFPTLEQAHAWGRRTVTITIH